MIDGNSFFISWRGIIVIIVTTLFTTAGKIIREGSILPKICPTFPECNGKEFRFKGKYYRCRLCNIAFTHDGIIVKRRKKAPKKCISPNCHGKDIRAIAEGFTCRSCGVEFTQEGKVIKSGRIVPKCPLSNCKGKDIWKCAEGYKCYNCGTIISEEGSIIRKGNPILVCPTCFLRNLRHVSGGCRCRRCVLFFL